MLSLSIACSRRDATTRDTAAGEVALTPGATVRDTAPAGASTGATSADVASDSKHVSAINARYGEPKDADQAFLRMMADHHEGLIVMTAPVLDQSASPQVVADAKAFRAKQERDLRDMLSLLQRKYGEAYEPTVTPSNRTMLDSLGRATGPAFDTLFYRQVAAHHQQGLDMIDRAAPKLHDAQVKAMAERMRTEQTHEVAELEPKAGVRRSQ